MIATPKGLGTTQMPRSASKVSDERGVTWESCNAAI